MSEANSERETLSNATFVVKISLTLSICLIAAGSFGSYLFDSRLSVTADPSPIYILDDFEDFLIGCAPSDRWETSTSNATVISSISVIRDEQGNKFLNWTIDHSTQETGGKSEGATWITFQSRLDISQYDHLVFSAKMKGLNNIVVLRLQCPDPGLRYEAWGDGRSGPQFVIGGDWREVRLRLPNAHDDGDFDRNFAMDKDLENLNFHSSLLLFMNWDNGEYHLDDIRLEKGSMPSLPDVAFVGIICFFLGCAITLVAQVIFRRLPLSHRSRIKTLSASFLISYVSIIIIVSSIASLYAKDILPFLKINGVTIGISGFASGLTIYFARTRAGKKPLR